MRHSKILAAIVLATPLAFAQDSARLLAPRPAFRLLEGPSATLSYVLNSPPDNPVVIEIRDASGGTVATLHPETMQPGLNRVDWDLRYEPPLQVALRTTPPEDPHIWEEPRFQGADTRPVAHKGIEQAQFGPIAAPGHYTVNLRDDIGAVAAMTNRIEGQRKQLEDLFAPNAMGS